MPRQQIGIVSGFYTDRSLPIAAQSCKNLYPHIPITDSASSKGALLSTPGLVRLNQVNETEYRGGRVVIDSNGVEKLYAVYGTRLYSLTSGGLAANLGQIPGTGRVYISWNGFVLCIVVPGVKGYFYDTTNGIQEITDASYTLNPALTVDFKDGYFVFHDKSSLFLSDAYATDPTTEIDGNFASAEASPDNIVRVATLHNELYVFGDQTIELFQNTGASPFPFLPIKGATLDRGLFSRDALVKYGNGLAFLGNAVNETPAIWLVSGGSVRKLSTPAIDQVLESYVGSGLENTSMWSYSENGAVFLGVTLANTTLVYDSTASQVKGFPVWHERSSGSSRWQVEEIFTMGDRLVATCYNSGYVAELSSSSYTEFNVAVDREFTAPYLSAMGNDLVLYRVEIESENGVGVLPGQGDGADPTVTLYISDDSGRTFESFGSQNLGAYGVYSDRQIWYRLGRGSTRRLLRFKTTDPVKVNFLNLYVDGIAEAR